VVAAEAAEQVGPDRVEQVVAVQLQAVHQGERGGRALDLGHRDGPVEGHHRARGHGQELVVEGDDLPPVGVGQGRRVAVDGVDGGLELVGAGLVAAQAAPDDGLALGDAVAVPAAAVLVAQRDEVAALVGAGGPAGVDQQHEGEQPHHLGLVGHELGQEPPEPDGLGAQLLADQPVARAGRAALVEDQVDDGQHGPEAVGELGLAGDPVGDPGVADLALGPDQPLGHGRLGHQEGAGDLGRGEPAQQPQRQGHLGAGAERRVAAGEDQAQPVVGHGALLGRRLRLAPQQDRLGVAVLAGRLPAEPVDRPVPGGGDDPAGRARWRPGRRPAPHGLGEGVLDRLLGQVDVADDADQDGDRAAVLAAEHRLDLGGGQGGRVGAQSSTSPWNGRTSIGRPAASASRRPQPSAASRSGALMMVNPAMCSLLST
jgi:hypothetical protein